MPIMNDKNPSAGPHPAQEEWMEYLYDEASVENRSRLSDHLRSCDECRCHLSAWNRANSSLDAWQLPNRHNPRFWNASFFKWGLAAMLTVGFAFWAGRFTAPGPDLTSIRAEIHKEVVQQENLIYNRNAKRMTEAIVSASKQEIQRTMEDRLTTLQASHREASRSLIDAIQNLATQQALDYANLRSDLETLAVTAQGEILSTRKNFANLAAYASIANTKTDTKDQ